MGPVAAMLPGGRLHLQHGPIDLIIGVTGDSDRAFAAARTRFQTVLEELVPELPRLRARRGARPHGAIARAMFDAVSLHDGFVTPMAAVAGAVADAVLASMVAGSDLTRAYVNNGGDIALHLTEDDFRLAMAGHDGSNLGRLVVRASDQVRGIATSGRHGRSHSLGIADSVTVLALTAAQADAAATLIANAVDLPGHRGITRARACDLDEGTDLGTRDVVTGCAILTAEERAQALAAGVARAEAMRALGLIAGAALFLQGEARIAGQAGFELTGRARVA